MPPPDDNLDLTNLLVLFFGQLGDAVLSLPALDFLRDALPGANISIGCGLPVGELFELWGRADRLLPLDRVRVRDTGKLDALFLMLAYVRQVWDLHPQAVLVLHPNREMNLVGWISGARRRMGVVFKPSLFNLLLNRRVEGKWKHQHAGVSYLQAARLFCGQEQSPTPMPSPALGFVRPESRTGQVVIHTGAGNPKRVLEPRRWAQVASAIRARTGRPVAFVSGPEEPGLARELAERVDGTTAYTGLSMRQLARLLSRASFFVGSDSGPGHLAAALRTPSLTLISEHIVSRYRPLGLGVRLLRYEGGIASVSAERIVQAVLDHPQFGSYSPVPRGVPPRVRAS